MSKGFSQIVVSDEVKARLQFIGKTGQSFDSLLRDLLSIPQKPRKKKETKDGKARVSHAIS